MSGAQGSEQQRVSQAAWLFLILALALLLGAIVLATADTGWLDAQQLSGGEPVA